MLFEGFVTQYTLSPSLSVADRLLCASGAGVEAAAPTVTAPAPAVPAAAAGISACISEWVLVGGGESSALVLSRRNFPIALASCSPHWNSECVPK
jgi:hypothetical protein